MGMIKQGHSSSVERVHLKQGTSDAGTN